MPRRHFRYVFLRSAVRPFVRCLGAFWVANLDYQRQLRSNEVTFVDPGRNHEEIGKNGRRLTDFCAIDLLSCIFLHVRQFVRRPDQSSAHLPNGPELDFLGWDAGKFALGGRIGRNGLQIERSTDNDWSDGPDEAGRWPGGDPRQFPKMARL